MALLCACAGLGGVQAADARAAASPADAPNRAIVTAAWVAEHLDDPDLVLLHVGEKQGYEQAHLPGARYVTLSDVSVAHAADELHLEMLPIEELRARLERLGITDRSKIVVYYGTDWVSPSTRVLLTLDYAGLGAQSFLLDGGMPAWQREGRPVTAAPPTVKPGRLTPRAAHDFVVDAAWVRKHLGRPGYAVVDARAGVFYDGVEAGGKRSGHIAGALSLPYTEVLDDALRLKQPEALAELFRRAGVRPGDVVIGYCHIGQQATTMLFAARSLGYDVRLYDGSFQDWDRRTDLPVETRRAPQPAGRR